MKTENQQTKSSPSSEAFLKEFQAEIDLIEKEKLEAGMPPGCTVFDLNDAPPEKRERYIKIFEREVKLNKKVAGKLGKAIAAKKKEESTRKATF